MKRFLSVFIAIAVCLGTSTLLYAKVVNKVAAVVNNEVITELDVERAMSATDKTSSSVGPTGEDGRKQILNRLIDEKLFDQIIKKSKIEVSDDELAKAIAGVLNDNGISIDKLKEELALKGIGYEQYKKEIERQIKKVKFTNQVIGPEVKITDQDLRDYYQRHQDKFRGSHSAHIAEIVLSLDGLTTQAEFESLRDTAMSIVSKARSGTNFAKLAKEYSKDASSDNGGDIGMVDLKSLPAPVSSAVRALVVGQVSNPVFDGKSLVIVKLISLPEISAGDFERLRDNIYQALYEEKMEDTLRGYVQKERQKAYISIR